MTRLNVRNLAEVGIHYASRGTSFDVCLRSAPPGLLLSLSQDSHCKAEADWWGLIRPHQRQHCMVMASSVNIALGRFSLLGGRA